MAIDELDALNASIEDEPTGSEEINTEEPQTELPVDDARQDDEPLTEDGDQSSESEEVIEMPEDMADLSGIERYLAQYDIEGGMITFDDGTQEHFSKLSPEKQEEVLASLHDVSALEIEDQYGLDGNEIGLINFLRENNTTIEEVIDQLAAQRAQTYLMSQQINDLDVEQLDDDTVYSAFLLRSNPEATPEQLEKDLETAKQMSNYKSIVDNLRQGFEEEKRQYIEQQQEEEYQAKVEEIEQDRKEIVDTVQDLEEIDGLRINDGIKNDVLDAILQVDEDGDSLFMTQVFSDPYELFRAAFWYTNGADILQHREEYWRKEKSAAYKRGLEDAKHGRKSFLASDVKEDKNSTRRFYGDPDETISLDDLHI